MGQRNRRGSYHAPQFYTRMTPVHRVQGAGGGTKIELSYYHGVNLWWVVMVIPFKMVLREDNPVITSFASFDR